MKKKVKALWATMFVASSNVANGMVVLAKTTPKPSGAGSDPTETIKSGFVTIQTMLLAIVAVVGVVSALKVLIAKMPNLDDPHEKSEMWKSLGSILAAVGVAAIIVIVVPWIYSSFGGGE